MVSVNESKQLARSAKKEVYKWIGRIVSLAPCVVGMSLYRFYIEVAPYWKTGSNVGPDTVKRDLSRGIPAKLSCSQVTTAIEQAYQSYIANLKPPDEQKELIEKLHDEMYPHIFETIERMYKLIETIDCGQSWIERVNVSCSREMVNAFIFGRIPKDGDGLTAKEAEWLRKALLELPPKGIDIPTYLN